MAAWVSLRMLPSATPHRGPREANCLCTMLCTMYWPATLPLACRVEDSQDELEEER